MKSILIEVLSAHPAVDGVLGLQQRRDALVLRALIGLAYVAGLRFQGRNGTEVHFLVGLPRCLALINSELWARVGAFFLVLVLVKALGLALDF